eukprot:363084-Chlamydomonas_euryale.AAC.6
MPDESVVQQLLFAEELVGLGGVVGRPRSTWRDRASVAVRPVLTSRFAGGVGTGWLRTVSNGMPFVTAPSPLLDPLCLAALNTSMPFAHLHKSHHRRLAFVKFYLLGCWPAPSGCFTHAHVMIIYIRGFPKCKPITSSMASCARQTPPHRVLSHPLGLLHSHSHSDNLHQGLPKVQNNHQVSGILRSSNSTSSGIGPPTVAPRLIGSAFATLPATPRSAPIIERHSARSIASLQPRKCGPDMYTSSSAAAPASSPEWKSTAARSRRSAPDAAPPADASSMSTSRSHAARQRRMSPAPGLVHTPRSSRQLATCETAASCADISWAEAAVAAGPAVLVRVHARVPWQRPVRALQVAQQLGERVASDSVERYTHLPVVSPAAANAAAGAAAAATVAPGSAVAAVRGGGRLQ